MTQSQLNFWLPRWLAWRGLKWHKLNGKARLREVGAMKAYHKANPPERIP